MKIRHVKKLSNSRYLPDDDKEPELGAIVEVPEELGVALIARGWGADPEAPWPPRIEVGRLPSTSSLHDRATMEARVREDGFTDLQWEEGGLFARPPVEETLASDILVPDGVGTTLIDPEDLGPVEDATVTPIEEED